MRQDYDLLIVGAGVVGSSLALALAHLPLKIALIEQMPFRLDVPLSDSKPIALNVASCRILQTLMLWPALADYANPIEQVHISQQACFGQARMRAQDMGVPQLGYVIPAARLGGELIRALSQCAAGKTAAKASFDLFNPAQCQSITKTKQAWEVLLSASDNEEVVIYPRLVIAADGSDSSVRNLLNIGLLKTRTKSEMALSTSIDISGCHRDIAYQRFTPHGIIASLPLLTNKIGLVWTADKATIHSLKDLTASDFLQRLQSHFSYRFGQLLRCTKPNVYSLKSFIAQPQAQPGLVLLGNAAHTLLPIAAQGLNLALQDMSELADIIANALKTATDLADPSLSQSYLDARLPVHQQIIGFTNHLAERFQSGFKPLTFIHNNGLLIMDLLSPCKRNLSRRLMGTHGRFSRLMRGLTLQQEEY
jgi:2-octaprenyl-6-methoxyphenol hydroxylase